MSGRIRFWGWGGLVGAFLLIILTLRFVIPPLVTRFHAWRIGGEVAIVETEFGKIFSRVSRESTSLLEREFTVFFRAVLLDYGPVFDFGDHKLSDLDLTLDLWESQEELARYYRNTRREDFSNNGGYYDPGSRTIAIVVPPLADSAYRYASVRRSAFHEATHLAFDVFTSGRGARYPRWLSEGLAVYFEGTTVEDGRAEIGGRSRLTSQLLLRAARARLGLELGDSEKKEAELPDLTHLMAAEGEFRSENNDLYYAQSMLLTHYLMEEAGGEVRSAFLDLCRSPPPNMFDLGGLARALRISPKILAEGYEEFLKDLLG